LLGDGIGDDRVRVTEARHRQPAQEIEIPLAVAVPQLCAAAAHEHHRRRAVVRHDRTPLERVRCPHGMTMIAHGEGPLSVVRACARAIKAALASEVSMVPMPASVNSSISKHVRHRAVEHVHRAHTVLYDAMQASILGIIPPLMVPSAISCAPSLTLARRMRLLGIVDVGEQPVDVGEYTSFSACSDSAMRGAPCRR
jgi:hypothetical protein